MSEMGHLASDLQQFIYPEVYSVLEVEKMTGIMEKPKIVKEGDHYVVKAGNISIHFLTTKHVFVIGAVADELEYKPTCSASLKTVWETP